MENKNAISELYLLYPQVLPLFIKILVNEILLVVTEPSPRNVSMDGFLFN